jgi:hypothetical protein
MSLDSLGIERTNYFSGGDRKREELSADPACPPCGEKCTCNPCHIVCQPANCTCNCKNKWTSWGSGLTTNWGNKLHTSTHGTTTFVSDTGLGEKSIAAANKTAAENDALAWL